jgi:hypothetical protein
MSKTESGRVSFNIVAAPTVLAALATLWGIAHYWDRLVWSLILPMVFAWWTWTILVMKLDTPSGLFPNFLPKHTARSLFFSDTPCLQQYPLLQRQGHHLIGL